MDARLDVHAMNTLGLLLSKVGCSAWAPGQGGLARSLGIVQVYSVAVAVERANSRRSCPAGGHSNR
jgi:hypothetical protein